MNRYDFINWFEDVRMGTRRLITVVPDEAFDFRSFDDSPTVEQLMRAFAGLEGQFIKGVCIGDWYSSHPTDARRQLSLARAEETDDIDSLDGGTEILETSDEILDNLDNTHQEALDIIADLTDEEFHTRKVQVPWGEEGTIERLLIGMVEREIHHRTELYMTLRHYGIKMSDMIIWGP